MPNIYLVAFKNGKRAEIIIQTVISFFRNNKQNIQVLIETSTSQLPTINLCSLSLSIFKSIIGYNE